MDHAEFTARRSLPMMALRGLTVFPGMMLTFEVERSMSIAALNMAMSDDQIIYMVPQKDIATDIPTPDDVYGVGTVCRIKQMMKQPGTKTIRVMAEGIERGRTLAVRTDMPCFVAEVEPMPDVQERKTARTEALIRHCCNLFDAYVTASGNMAPESVISVLGSTNAAFVSNFISQHVFLRPEEKQELLEETRPSRRLSKLSKMLLHETSVLGLQHQLEEAAQDRLNQTQQEYLLREQMKIIQAELGESDDPDSESADYREKILALHLPADSEQRLLKEVDRLKKQPFGSSEAAVIRNYLDICLELPWNTRTKETLDVRAAREVLDKEHFGLEKVKDRITEYLAVRQLAPDVKGGVLCLVGPPGTGKTSIAMSIAHATNRKLARISLGGVHDEAEIRGHRKTYVGAMPGRIINGLTIAGSMNPVMVLDEIDKLGSDYRGDPSSALLEVLDAEQNDHFRDNFMEIPVDLSDVFFILTANTLDTIPRPLLDRMEVIQLSSYTDEEKLQIAKQHLLPAFYSLRVPASYPLQPALRSVFSTVFLSVPKSPAACVLSVCFLMPKHSFSCLLLPAHAGSLSDSKAPVPSALFLQFCCNSAIPDHESAFSAPLLFPLFSAFLPILATVFPESLMIVLILSVVSPHHLREHWSL